MPGQLQAVLFQPLSGLFRRFPGLDEDEGQVPPVGETALQLLELG
jgi:hypothetical protein